MDIKPATQRPELLFEVSWEVCNKIGGIYTVLSTKAKTLQKISKDTSNTDKIFIIKCLHSFLFLFFHFADDIINLVKGLLLSMYFIQ